VFGIPDEYNICRATDLKKFPLSHLKPAERKRFRGTLKELILESVVKDDSIPSYVCDTDTVMAIQFFSAHVDSLRTAPFVCGILQRMIKTPCVITIRDERDERHSFALKRLNLQDNNSVVVMDEFLTHPLPRGVAGTDDHLMHEFAGWDAIVNRTNLYSFYLEMTVKCYIITHRDVWSGMQNLLSSGVWYNTEDVMEMYREVKQVVHLTEERGKSLTVGDSARLNGELKYSYDKLIEYIRQL
jgi:hypothetical protein